MVSARRLSFLPGTIILPCETLPPRVFGFSLTSLSDILSCWCVPLNVMDHFRYILEQSLSVDNLFVFVLVFKYFKVPFMYQVMQWLSIYKMNIMIIHNAVLDFQYIIHEYFYLYIPLHSMSIVIMENLICWKYRIGCFHMELLAQSSSVCHWYFLEQLLSR